MKEHKICVMGFGPTNVEAPLDDPSWEKFGLPWDDKWEKYDRLYEMHEQNVLQLSNSVVLTEEWDGEKILTQAHRPQNYFKILKQVAEDKNKTLYMHDTYFPGVVSYPFKKVISATRDYFISSVTYMLSHAISLNPTHIAVYGIDMHGNDEWVYQRPCVEYLLGLAEGRGIEVTVPEGSWLLKFQPERVRFGAIMIEYYKRYGILGPDPQKFERWV
jgi:hypothetical protein|tara:strand:+ start:543 stop:1190 length:648 start_codon:yes stop_codon:yes gene_type:complete